MRVGYSICHLLRIERLSNRIIGAAIEVHKQLGPGLLESTYERCLAQELLLKGISAKRQVILPINYKGLILDEGYRIDILVEDRIILEIKAARILENIHTAQMITYLKLSRIQLGLLLNFNVMLMKQGIKRVVLDYPEHEFGDIIPMNPSR